MMCWDKAEFTTHKAVVFQLPFPAGRWHCHSKRGGGQTGAVGINSEISPQQNIFCVVFFFLAYGCFRSDESLSRCLCCFSDHLK